MLLLSALLVFFLFALGLGIGSFLNAAEYRLSTGRRLTVSPDGGWERSQCVQCEKTLAPTDLVPVLSYVWLGGRCRYCHERISPQYPLVELATAAAFALVGVVWGATIDTAVGVAFATVLVFIFLYDFKHQLILNRVTVPAAALALVGSLLLGRTAADLAIGALVGGGFFGLQYVVSRGRWIGGGDIRFGIVIGLMLGWQKTVLTLFLAYTVGALVALVLLASRRAERTSRLAFGTFLAAATFVSLLFGDRLIGWYLGLLL
jgi:prepilin signal peptidase PulO-like enzyme (type II secretory pathway)